MAITETLDLLQELQAVDSGIKACEDELTALPRNLAAAQEEEKGVQAQVDEAQGRVDAILKRRRELESEIEGLGGQVMKFETQKTQVKTNAEYHAINHQIAHAKEQASALEDQVLASFDEEEAGAMKVGQIQAKLAEVKKTVAARQSELEVRAKEDEARLVELRSRRDELVPKMEPRLVTRYEAMRTRKGNAVVSVQGGVCQGCFSGLPPQIVNEVKKRNKVHNCEFCGRFLVHDPDAEAGG